jgi:predicted DNA-binding transcriptional regulator AlpA
MLKEDKPTRLLNDNEVAEELGISVSTLRKWRYSGQGPRFVKLGASVRYKPEDITRFLASCETGGGEA